MSIVYVDEYESSSAQVRLGHDPFYVTSRDDERIRIRRVAAPSPIGILIIFGLLYLITRK